MQYSIEASLNDQMTPWSFPFTSDYAVDLFWVEILLRLNPLQYSNLKIPSASYSSSTCSAKSSCFRRCFVSSSLQLPGVCLPRLACRNCYRHFLFACLRDFENNLNSCQTPSAGLTAQPINKITCYACNRSARLLLHQMYAYMMTVSGLPVSKTLVPLYLRHVRFAVAVGLKSGRDSDWKRQFDLWRLACRGLPGSTPIPCCMSDIYSLFYSRKDTCCRHFPENKTYYAVSNWYLFLVNGIKDFGFGNFVIY